MNRASASIAVAGLTIAATVGFGTVNEAIAAPVDSALGCVETSIVTLHAPTGESMADGGSITFGKNIAPGHGANGHPILGVYVPPDSYLTGSVGDRVRVCLISVPRKTDACDPVKDDRGRQFLIYDRKLSIGMLFSDGEHDCGGA